MDKQFEIIESYFYKRISFTELKEKIPDFCKTEYFELLIRKCIEYQLIDDLEFIFHARHSCKNKPMISAQLYAELLLEDWHIMHESFAFCLQDIKEYSPYIVNSLYNTAMNKLPYLEFENSEALARKCVYALGAIDTVESRSKLIELAKKDDVAVRDYAIHQLKKRGYPELIPNL